MCSSFTHFCVFENECFQRRGAGSLPVSVIFLFLIVDVFVVRGAPITVLQRGLAASGASLLLAFVGVSVFDQNFYISCVSSAVKPFGFVFDSWETARAYFDA